MSVSRLQELGSNVFPFFIQVPVLSFLSWRARERKDTNRLSATSKILTNRLTGFTVSVFIILAFTFLSFYKPEWWTSFPPLFSFLSLEPRLVSIKKRYLAVVNQWKGRRRLKTQLVKENSVLSCYIRVLLSTVELSLHPLSSHEVESVRKEKERLTAASAALSFPFMCTLDLMIPGKWVLSSPRLWARSTRR